MKVFVSYSQKDKQRILEIVARLEDEGILVWFDEKLPVGRAFDRVIEDEIQDVDVVITIWTRNSVESHWVRSEAAAALGQKKLLPVLFESVEIPVAFRLIETVDLVGWTGDPNHPDWRRLVNRLNSERFFSKDKDNSEIELGLTKSSAATSSFGRHFVTVALIFSAVTIFAYAVSWFVSLF